jgi:hypothetical protein
MFEWVRCWVRMLATVRIALAMPVSGEGNSR